MADIILQTGSVCENTPVPNYFIDAYMADANGDYVKVYLYLIRCYHDRSMRISTADIVKRFHYTEEFVTEALQYWDEAGLIRITLNRRGEVCSIVMLQDAYVDAPQLQRRAHDTQMTHDSIRSAKASRTSGTVRTDADTMSIHRETLDIAERYFGHPLSTTEIETILSWMDELHLNGEIIDYLMSDSISKGKSDIRYMNRIALSLADEGIETVADAKRRSEEFSASPLYRQVQRAFGITSRTLVSAEKERIESWITELDLPVEIILEACERTIKNTGKASFDYADSILQSWHESGVKTPDDIKRLDDDYKARLAKPKVISSGKSTQNKLSRGWNFEQREYDMGQLEKQLLRKA